LSQNGQFKIYRNKPPPNLHVGHWRPETEQIFIIETIITIISCAFFKLFCCFLFSAGEFV
jgi:hypothetical protein